MTAAVQTVGTREVVELLFRRARRALFGFAVPMVLAIVAAVFTGTHYLASATLLARMGQEYLYRGPIGDSIPMGFEREQTLKSELAILTSRDLATRTIQAIGQDRLYPGRSAAVAVDRFAAALDAQLLNKSNVIQVRFRHADPHLAADVVNTLLKFYIDRRRDIFFDPRVEVLNGEVQRYHQQLGEIERQTERFKRGNGIVSFGEQRDLLLRQRAELDARVKVATNNLAEIQRRLAEQRRNIDAAERVGRLAVIDTVEAEVLRLQAEESAAIAAHAVQSRQLAELEERIATLANSERDMDRLSRELALAAETYQTYARKLEEARILEIMERGQLANVRVIQAATPPARPVSFRALILAAGAVLGLTAAAAVVFLSEWRRDTFATPEALERAVKFPVIAEFPAEERRQ